MCDSVYFTAHSINILYVNHMCVIVFILQRIYVCDSVYFTAHSINNIYILFKACLWCECVIALS